MRHDEKNQCWRGCGETGTQVHCWWSYESVQPFCKAIWNHAYKMQRTFISFDPRDFTSRLLPTPQYLLKEDPPFTKIFGAALFVTAKNQKQRRSSSVAERVSRLWYRNIMEMYCAVRNDGRITSERLTFMKQLLGAGSWTKCFTNSISLDPHNHPRR